MAKGPTASQVRGDIDRGRTGDKKPGFDPAAAPLETDAEAGGNPSDVNEARQARADQRAQGTSESQGRKADAMRSFEPTTRSAHTFGWKTIAVFAVIGLALLGALLLAFQ